MQQYGDLTRAQLEFKVKEAHTAVLAGEKYGWMLGVVAAVFLGFVVTWFVSVPLAIGAYILTMKPKRAALEKAEAELKAYEDSHPMSTYY